MKEQGWVVFASEDDGEAKVHLTLRESSKPLEQALEDEIGAPIPDWNGKTFECIDDAMVFYPDTDPSLDNPGLFTMSSKDALKVIDSTVHKDDRRVWFKVQKSPEQQGFVVFASKDAKAPHVKLQSQ